MNNIVIEYPSGTQVKGARTVHAMQGNMTLCKRRPLRFTETDDVVTCQECLKVLPAVSKPPRLKRDKPNGDSIKYRLSPSKGEPGYGAARCWVLTQKGLDYLAKMEAEERGK